MARQTTKSPSGTAPIAQRNTTPAEASDAVTLNNTRTPAKSRPGEDQIRARAFFLWDQAGRPDGDGVQYWLEAEKELSNPR